LDFNKDAEHSLNVNLGALVNHFAASVSLIGVWTCPAPRHA